MTGKTWDQTVAERAAEKMRERAAHLAETYDNGQFTDKDTWAEGFAFAKRMIAANIRGLPIAAALLALAACIPAQLDRAATYQAQIAQACSVAMSLAPVAGPIAPWIVGGCATEVAIARLALDPSSHEWLRDMIAKVRALRG